MDNWIETIAMFQEPNEDLEKMGIEQCTEDIPTPFVFRVNDLMAFNEGSTKDVSTIWLRGGYRLTIKMSFEDLRTAIMRSNMQNGIYNHTTQNQPMSNSGFKNFAEYAIKTGSLSDYVQLLKDRDFVKWSQSVSRKLKEEHEARMKHMEFVHEAYRNLFSIT